MKSKIQLLIAVLALTAATFTGCKKGGNNETDYTTELETHSDDQSRVQSESDAIADDANTVVDNYPSFNGRETNTLAIPCDATVVVDSLSNPKTVTITYNGTNCGRGRTRVGVVILSMPANMRWRDAGATLTVTIQNLRITRLSDNKSIVVNGTKTITNVTGGLVRNLSALGSITHTITSPGITVTFDNNTQRSWQIAKRRVFTYNNGVVVTTTGTATVDGVTGVSEWGTNRFGGAFITSISQPMVVRQDCSFRLTAGQVTHSKLVTNVVATFGLDASGNPTTCPTGAYYMKLVWTGATGATRTVIRPY